MTTYQERESKRQLWLNNLTVGTTVFVRNSGDIMRPAIVTNITAKRRDITIKYDLDSTYSTLFDSRGSEKKDYGTRDSLHEYNAESIAENEAKRQEIEDFKTVKNTEWRFLSHDKLARIAAILREEQ